MLPLEALVELYQVQRFLDLPARSVDDVGGDLVASRVPGEVVDDRRADRLRGGGVVEESQTLFVAAVAAAAASFPIVPVTNAALAAFLGGLVTSVPVFTAKLAASLATGAPHLSNVTKTE